MKHGIGWGLLAFGLCISAWGTDLYVSPAGQDGWSGKLAAANEAGTDGPFLTLERACIALRELVAAGPLAEPVAVQIREGLYPISAPLVLGADCSGTATCPVTFRAYPKETPVLSGARPILEWAPYRDGILQADLSRLGLGETKPRQLFLGGKRQRLARYPNFDPSEPITGGWAYVAATAPPAAELAAVGAKRVMQVREGDARHWANPTQGEVFIFSGHEWWNNIVPIAAVSPDGATVTLARNCSYEIAPEDRYFVQGLPEELDAPGEWALDATGKTLFFLPPAPLADEPVYVPVTRTILQLTGAQQITVQGLTFAYCDGNAVEVTNSTDCRIVACTIRNVGDYNGSAVRVSGGERNGVVGCDIADVGNSGIALSGGEPKTRTPAGNYAENNHITRTGVFYKQGSGISVTGVGNRISRNTIHQLPRFAIQFGGDDNLIEENELYDLSLETTDTGAIYGGSLNWLSAHGTVIRHNFIHDVVGCGRRNGKWQAPFFAWGVYLDWSAMGVTVEGNIITRVPRGGIMVHDGRFNRIQNNILFDCGTGLHDSGSQIEASGWNTGHFFWKRGLEFGWVKAFESVADQPAWHGEGSTLCDPRTTALPDGRTMHSNTFERNILAYRDAKAQAFLFRNVSSPDNPSDHNLIWPYGQPVRTGLFRVKETMGDNLAPNGGFEQGEAGAMPADWSARLPSTQSEVQVVADGVHGGDKALRLRGVSSPEFGNKPTWERQVMAQTRFIDSVVPGQHYRLSAWLRADAPATAVRLEALSFKGGTYDVRFAKPGLVGTDWERYEVVFRFPQEGDANYQAGMDQTFYLRVILGQDEGLLWLDDVQLHAATAMPEWEAWQADGMDRHSVIADPLFVDPAKDDYRLKPESPAWGLGFRPIPVERIGCYQDALRATWPLRK